jgi:hypothetical protein
MLAHPCGSPALNLPYGLPYGVISGCLTVAITYLPAESGMSVESLMAHTTPEALKGRKGGWLQAGSPGGGGLGGDARQSPQICSTSRAAEVAFWHCW